MKITIEFENLAEFQKYMGQTGKGVFTITEVQDGWGKLKCGAGWISLDYASKI